MRVLMVLIGFGVALGCGLAAFLLLRSPSSEPERTLFAWGGGLPLLVDVDHDGVDDVIGNSGGELVLLDGKTWQKRWAVKSDGFTVLAGDDALAVATEWDLVLRALQTGAELSREKKSDRIVGMCFADGVVWTRAFDEIVSGTKVATGAKLTAHGKQLPCETKEDPTASHCGSGSSGCLPHRDYELVHGNDHVRLTFKRPGTPIATATGLGSDGKELFRQVVEDKGYGVHAAELAEGKLFVLHTGTLYAYDARTGAPLWRAGTGTSGSYGLMVRRGRVYTSGTGHRNYRRLMIYDVQTGTLLAQLGG